MVRLLQAVIFDMDGVIAETEGEGHRIAFNETFKKEGIKAAWDQENIRRIVKNLWRERTYAPFLSGKRLVACFR